MKLHLVDDWRQSWRWLSVQLSWGAGALSAAIIAAAPGLAFAVLTAPLWQRLVVGGAVAAAIIVLPWLARILKQPSKVACDGE
jgi:hypothetical protein